MKQVRCHDSGGVRRTSSPLRGDYRLSGGFDLRSHRLSGIDPPYAASEAPTVFVLAKIHAVRRRFESFQ